MAKQRIPPVSLFNQLTAFSYEQDPEFARGDSDTMRVKRATQNTASYLTSDDGEMTFPLYDEKKILFRAERSSQEDTSKRPNLPISFIIRQEIITQLHCLPGTLVEQLKDELEDCYDTPESGDFNTLQYVHYSVTRDEDDTTDISIDRNIGYILRDYDDILYETSELIGQPEPQYVPIAHDQQTLRVFSPIKQDAVEDRIEQVSYNALFEEIFDGVSNMKFYNEYVKTRDADATIGIIGLVNCIQKRRALPNKLLT
jgi:hypothetical protein